MSIKNKILPSSPLFLPKFPLPSSQTCVHMHMKKKEREMGRQKEGERKERGERKRGEIKITFALSIKVFQSSK